MEYKRVKDKSTGHEFSLPVGSFDDADGVVLDKPALDESGQPLPIKYKTTVDKAAKAPDKS